MTELSFLIELLLNHKVPKVTRDAIAGRIKQVEEEMAKAPSYNSNQAAKVPHNGAGAGAIISSRDVAVRHPELVTEVAVIAQTPAAANALASRQQAINEQLSGKVDKITGRPRKF